MLVADLSGDDVGDKLGEKSMEKLYINVNYFVDISIIIWYNIGRKRKKEVLVMSYDIAKKITINEKKNKITLSIASNNVYPHTYYTVEYGSGLLFEDKLACLMQSILNGNIHLGLSSNEMLFGLMNNTSNEDFKEIYEFNQSKIWQFDKSWDDRIEYTKQEVANLEEELRQKLLAYYKKYVNETIEKKYVLSYYGSYISRVNKDSISRCHTKSKARIMSLLAAKALQSMYRHITLIIEEV